MVPLLTCTIHLYFLSLTMSLAWAEFFKPLIPEKEKKCFSWGSLRLKLNLTMYLRILLSSLSRVLGLPECVPTLFLINKVPRIEFRALGLLGKHYQISHMPSHLTKQNKNKEKGVICLYVCLLEYLLLRCLKYIHVQMETILDSLELELQAIVNCLMWVTGNSIAVLQEQ